MTDTLAESDKSEHADEISIPSIDQIDGRKILLQLKNQIETWYKRVEEKLSKQEWLGYFEKQLSLKRLWLVVGGTSVGTLATRILLGRRLFVNAVLFARPFWETLRMNVTSETTDEAKCKMTRIKRLERLLAFWLIYAILDIAETAQKRFVLLRASSNTLGGIISKPSRGWFLNTVLSCLPSCYYFLKLVVGISAFWVPELYILERIVLQSKKGSMMAKSKNGSMMAKLASRFLSSGPRPPDTVHSILRNSLRTTPPPSLQKTPHSNAFLSENLETPKYINEVKQETVAATGSSPSRFSFVTARSARRRSSIIKKSVHKTPKKVTLQFESDVVSKRKGENINKDSSSNGDLSFTDLYVKSMEKMNGNFPTTDTNQLEFEKSEDELDDLNEDYEHEDLNEDYEHEDLNENVNESCSGVTIDSDTLEEDFSRVISSDEESDGITNKNRLIDDTKNKELKSSVAIVD